MRTWFVRAILIFSICLCHVAGISADESWTSISRGLDLGIFKARRFTPIGDSTLTILRIDPGYWKLILLSRSKTGEPGNLNARQWSEKYHLVAATNAGMFATDYSTHVGFMQCDGHTNSSWINHYQSVAAFFPLLEGLPTFRIFDLDMDDMPSIRKRYGCVVQNLRLIKRPGENRWKPQGKIWSEAALGEDRSGRILFIFCRSPYSMYDLNNILLALPIEIVCAQHLEGGQEAQLFVNAGNMQIEEAGSYGTDFSRGDGNIRAWPVPNVIGVLPKDR